MNDKRLMGAAGVGVEVGRGMPFFRGSVASLFRSSTPPPPPPPPSYPAITVAATPTHKLSYPIKAKANSAKRAERGHLVAVTGCTWPLRDIRGLLWCTPSKLPVRAT